MTWQTRLICSYVAASNPPEDGSANKLLETAQEIDLGVFNKKSSSEGSTDDNSSERPAKYASSAAMLQFSRGLAGGPMQAW